MVMELNEDTLSVQDFGVATSFGSRSYMEDFHSMHVVRDKLGFFGVYDGHGGTAAAEFCAKNMHLEVAARLKALQGFKVLEWDLHQVLTAAFLHVDQCLQDELHHSQPQKCLPREDEEEGEEAEEEEYVTARSTAVVALVDYCRRKVVVGNVGDSRVILSRNGKAIDLAKAHDPEDPEERDRIIGAGGKILPNGYLSTADDESSTLSMSRSIGDFEFKTNTSLKLEQQMVIPLPDIMEETFGGDDDFLVLASDGIWMPSQEIVDFVVEQKRQCILSLAAIGTNLIYKADANDNMTIVIVNLGR